MDTPYPHPEIVPDTGTSAPADNAPTRPTWRRLLFGDDGLRAGWSLALYLLLLVLTGITAGFIVHLVRTALHLVNPAANLNSPADTIWSEAISVAVVIIPGLIMSLIERRPFARYGFTSRRWLPDLGAGAFWGLVNLSLLLAALLATHAISFDGLAERGAEALSSGAEWLLAFLLVGLFEEFAFRGYMQYTVARGVAGITRAIDPNNRHAHAIGFWTAASLFSVFLFVLGHIGNKGETPWGLLGVALAGLVLVFSLWRTGSLWWAVGWHCAWDWAQTCLYGTPDSGQVAHQHIFSTHPIGPALLSGGTTGPEGSVLLIPALLVAGLVIHLTLPRRIYPLTHDQAQPRPESLARGA